MSVISIYHNPRCSKSRAGLTALQGVGQVRVVQYLKEPLARDELLSLLEILEDPPGALVRRDANFKAAGLTASDVETAEQVASVLAKHPNLMERPVIVRDDRAIIGRPTERISAWLGQKEG